MDSNKSDNEDLEDGSETCYDLLFEPIWAIIRGEAECTLDQTAAGLMQRNNHSHQGLH